MTDSAFKIPSFRLLLLEDNPADVMLVRDMLAQENIAAEIHHVENRADFVQALEVGNWALVLADYHLPDFNGLEALKLVRAKYPLVPFILMSGTIGEQTAIESLKAGATDYVLKQHRDRLPAVVIRALAEYDERERRLAAEQELLKSEKQYRRLFQDNPHPMWVFDFEKLAIIEVNNAAIHHYGFSREEFLSMNLHDLHAPSRDSRGQAPVWDEMEKSLIWRHRRKDGGTMDMEINWSPMEFRGRLAALTMATDVTARRRAAHYNYIFGRLSQNLSAADSASAAASFICEAADDLFKWDEFALDLFEAERNEVVSLLAITTLEDQRVKLPSSLQPKAANVLVRRAIERGAELVSTAEVEGRTGAAMVSPIRAGVAVIGVLFVQSRVAQSYTDRDLQTLKTLAEHCGGALQRVWAEEELRQSQRRFRDLFENSPDAIFVEDMQGNVLDVNPSACVLHGMNREQLVGKNVIEDLVPPDQRATVRADFHRLSTGGISSLEGESLRADGRVVPVEIRVVRVEYDGQPAMLFHVRDITGRRAAEMALRSSETLFRSVWENSVDGMRLTDERGHVIAVNSAFCKLVGLKSEQIEDKPFSIIYSPEMDSAKLLERHRKSFASGLLPVREVRALVLHDGRSVLFEIKDSYVVSEGKPRLLLSLFRDITEHKRLEDQLRQSQKMDAVGQLAGGIAHDFNNILTIILGHATLLTMGALDVKAQVSAKQIKQAAERAAGLTRQLLAFGRKQVFNPRPLDLNRVVEKMSEMLGRLLGEDIALQMNFSTEPAMIEADTSMMEQILLNLSVNSRDAMPRGGHLTLRIDVCEVDDKHARRFIEARSGKYVRLSHTDSGCGIPPENLSRIFEPFFTTKELGKGTGLGLATVFGIVKQHHGWVEVESEMGKGTSFHVYLPFTREKAVEAVEFDTQFRSRGGNETILVVEDERDLREIITRTLNRHGYRVFQAADGLKALQIWEQYKLEINLMFTDVIMPGGVNGRELAERIWSEKPEMKVIFSSGYGADALGKDFKLDPELNYLQKPYLPQALVRIIRKCLDAKPD
ncbi:MAG: PAS domain S-box protein [Verrucomicrobiota bacterium]